MMELAQSAGSSLIAVIITNSTGEGLANDVLGGAHRALQQPHHQPQQQYQPQYLYANESAGGGHGTETHGYTTNPICILLPITIFYCFIFVAGIVGNLSICIVIAKNKSMHTATNYYLFNLAVSDFLLLLFGMPQELYGTWNPFAYPFNQIACIITGLLSETAANATVLTITSFTVERYIAICHPFRSHTMSKLSRAIKFVIVIWLVAFGLATPQALQFGIVESDGSRLCTIKDEHFVHAFEVSSFLFFVGPMTVIAVLYVLIGIKLRKSKLLQGAKRASSDYTTPPRTVSGQSRVIRMLVAVVATFFICWAPFHAQRLMAVYGVFTKTESVFFYKVYMVLNYISGILYFLSTCINPLLYNIMSHKFRDASRHTLKMSFCGGSNRNKSDGQQHTYSAVSRYGVTGGGSFKVNSNNMACIGTGITVGQQPGNGTTENQCQQESNLSLLAKDRSNRSTMPPIAMRPTYTRASDSHCVSISSSHSTTATNVSSNGKLSRSSNGSLRHGGNALDTSDSSGGRLSTIAEKLRRGTKKVLAFSKSPNSTPCKSAAGTAAEVVDERRKAYRKRNSCDSVDTNTISNSSLKEFDEEEFSSAELARFMGEVNSEIR
ncbi:pyrokinin-1 receptor-like [Anopheles stephensi]|uniref:pyrokinin-1 receptor-like n=1 Tax=Anopheles stephensi TaxID=30069 RepID=UPI001658B498|nr:pyrokinin-1 receptor-like [Anopheles stephensi]XP_035897101.1 pyrokinin-1 receptor-like [Anopheles stephensi]XP_035897102.1 pyrokinin-1 receptor-like [Anopheles stephensi]XP_035897103.1 pyrokinin-1 receptor-like [Anopheles stephensi]XP_035897104.1 pyrokinin-1 receptor-like [Anopheles stephensi]